MAEKKPSKRPKLSEAERAALIAAVKGGAETRGAIAKAMGISARRAQSALSLAVRRGHLIAVGKGNQTRYAASEKKAEHLRAKMRPTRTKAKALAEFAAEQHARGLVLCAEAAHALVVPRAWVTGLAQRAKILTPIHNANVSSRPLKFVDLRALVVAANARTALQPDQIIRLHRLASAVGEKHAPARELAEWLSEQPLIAGNHNIDLRQLETYRPLSPSPISGAK